MAQLCVMLPPWVVVCFMFYSLFLFQTKKKHFFFQWFSAQIPTLDTLFFLFRLIRISHFLKSFVTFGGGGFHLAFEVFRVLFLSFLSILGCQEALP